MPFGADDKAALLYQLGHARRPSDIELHHEEYTRVIGTVRHAATGAAEIDCDAVVRQETRRRSLDALLAHLDTQFGVPPLPA